MNLFGIIAASGGDTLRKSALALAVAVTASAASAQVALQPDSPAWRTVQLAHWQAFYEGRVAPPSDDPLANVLTGTHNDGPPAQPPLRAKYDHTSAAPGMDALASAEFRRLKAAMVPARAAALGGWSLTVSRCTATGPAILVAVDARAKRLCIAPILVVSLFLQSGGTDIARLTTYLRQHGVDPATFTGTYDRRLNQRGITRADWDSTLKAYSEPTWSSMRRSLDVVVARAVTCGALGGSASDCDREAAEIVRRIDPTGDVASLLAALRSASQGYDPASWGYEAAGDGEAQLSRVTAFGHGPPALAH